MATFVNRVNSKLHNQEQEERIRQINDRIGPFENVSAPPEFTSVCIYSSLILINFIFFNLKDSSRI